MSEDRLQYDCYTWFHSEFPELRGLLCYNLNNSRNKIQAMMDKGKGLQKGRADMVFYYKGVATMIEFKTPTGTQEPDQRIWQTKIEAAGFKYYLIKTLEDFQQIIRKIQNN